MCRALRQLRRFASTQTVRFAPSPTGALHVGGARTALFNYLVHRRAVLEGRPSAFVLRVDDSDAARNVPGSEAAILGDLEWLGVEWTAGPLRSSERSAVYAAAVDKLLASGAAYRDFDGDAAKWRGAPEADVAARVAAGEPHAVRFRVPRETGVAVEVDDVVRGTLRWADVNKACREDFVLARRDGRPLYVLCSAADDAALGVSHVVRAEEHVSNTLRQALVRVEIRSPTRLQCVLSGTDCTEPFGCASRTQREQSIRPKISRIDFESTEIESSVF